MFFSVIQVSFINWGRGLVGLLSCLSSNSGVMTVLMPLFILFYCLSIFSSIFIYISISGNSTIIVNILALAATDAQKSSIAGHCIQQNHCILRVGVEK